MGEDRTTAGPRRPTRTGVLLLAWCAGVLVPQIPFQFEMKLGNGSFGFNILLTLALVILGTLLVVGLLRAVLALSGGASWERPFLRASAALLGVSSTLALACFLFAAPTRRILFPLAVGALAIWLFLALAALVAGWRGRSRSGRLRLRPRGVRGPWVFNGAFWLLVFLILLGRDLFMLGQIEPRTALETFVLIAGRLLTLATASLAALLVTHGLLALFPAALRWLVVVAVAGIPAIIIADFAAGLYWQSSLLDILNSFTLAGRFDVTQLLEAAGIKNTPFQVFLAFLAVVALSVAAYLGLQRVSKRFKSRTRTSTRRALIMLGVLWLGTIGHQALCGAALRKMTWQAEHHAFKIHLGLLGPDPGYETIKVRFTEQQTAEEDEAFLAGPLPVLARKPDIYLVIVETWRADSITPVIAPFLHKFRAGECQQFDRTFAGSNCTPVSWFTIFHSRLGIHWKEAVAKENDPGGLRGSYPVRLLHRLGYKHSARAVCDLGYQKMADLNFGADHKLAASYLDNPMIKPRGLGIPEREIIVVDDLKKQLLDTPPGGHLHFLALDSPHYNYYWPAENFKPLHTDCAGNINYGSLQPSAEDIRKVVKRYENSIHWIDRQMEDFVRFLKENGRYDDALIILTGDHGEEFQEHGSWFHCSNLKKPQTEVPIMIKWPHWVRNQPPQALVSHLDIMPSVLDSLGLDEEYFLGLAGRSVLREHPGEAVISTLWAGTSRVGVCFLKDGMKANFVASKLWLGNVPKTLYFSGYADFDDQSLDATMVSGDLTHSAFLRQSFPDIVFRFFSKFGQEPDPPAGH